MRKSPMSSWETADHVTSSCEYTIGGHRGVTETTYKVTSWDFVIICAIGQIFKSCNFYIFL